MTAQEVYKQLVEKFGEEAITGLNTEAIDHWIEVAPSQLLEVAQYLKSDPALKFDSLTNLCGVDYMEQDAARAKKFPYEPHIEVVYHLFSMTHHHKVTMKVKTPRWKDDVEGQLPEVPSVSSVWAIADWHEREAYDLVGINFLGHPNLVRILCIDDWVGHPLRKDYEMPKEYHGIRNL